MKSIIFDFDGVLVDSFEFHLKNVNDLYGIALTAEEYRDIHDGNFYDSALKKLEGIDFEDYAEKVALGQSLLPLDDRAKTLLFDLAQSSLLFLVTSGWKSQVAPFLEKHAISGCFASCLYADDGKSKHEKILKILNERKILPEDCIFVTDTLGDILEAHELHIQCLAVSFGYHDKSRLLKGNPTFIADSWDEVRDTLSAFVLSNGVA